jgi:hypothetical protein
MINNAFVPYVNGITANILSVAVGGIGGAISGLVGYWIISKISKK